jgi:hypothetical protein
MDSFCVNKSTFMIVVIIVSIVGTMLYYNAKKSEQDGITSPKSCPKCECPTCKESGSCPPCQPTVPTVIGDVVKDYDRGKIEDPLEGPTRRVSRSQIPPWYLRRQIDLSTRGYADNYRVFGVLIQQGTTEIGKEQILQLYGRETIPRSNRYEYYTTFSSGVDQIKIPIDNPHNRELNDEEVITIAELGDAEYKVQLYPYDSPRYYPDIY